MVTYISRPLPELLLTSMSSTSPYGQRQHFWTEHDGGRRRVLDWKTTAEAQETDGEVGHGRSAMLEIVRVLPRLFEAHGSLLHPWCCTAPVPVGVSPKARF